MAQIAQILLNIEPYNHRCANLPNQGAAVDYIIIRIITKSLVQSYLQAAFIKLPGLPGNQTMQIYGHFEG